MSSRRFLFQLVEFVVGLVQLRGDAGRNGVVRSLGIDPLVVDRAVVQRFVQRRSISTARTLVANAFPLDLGGDAQVSRFERRRRFSTRREKLR